MIHRYSIIGVKYDEPSKKGDMIEEDLGEEIAAAVGRGLLECSSTYNVAGWFSKVYNRRPSAPRVPKRKPRT